MCVNRDFSLHRRPPLICEKKYGKTVTRDRSKLSAWEDMRRHMQHPNRPFFGGGAGDLPKKNDKPRSWVRLGCFRAHLLTLTVGASSSVTISHAAVTQKMSETGLRPDRSVK